MGKKNLPKIYTFSTFASSKDAAVQRFLHHAQDHMLASRLLRSNPFLLDSAAYICNIAFELLFKALHLAEKDQYEGIHKIIQLHNTLSNKIVSNADMRLLKVIDKYNLVRYPIDDKLQKMQPALKLGRSTFHVGEIGTEELEKADKLFIKIWHKLHRRTNFKTIINNICKNPHQKGNRILLRKYRGS